MSNPSPPARGTPFDLNLIVTYQCNLHCDHCISDCGPFRREILELTDGRRYIDQALSTGRLHVVGLTGGEPLLHYDVALRLMDHAFQRGGVSAGLVTNCYWAENDVRTGRTLRELHGCGLRHLTASCDGFHSPGVPLANVRRAVRAGLDLGITVCVNVVVTRTGPWSAKNLPPALDIRPEEWDGRFAVKEIGPLRIGRAARTLRPEEMISTDDEKWFNGPCPYVAKSIAVCPDGAVYACCCFGDSTVRPDVQIGYAGNLGQSSLAEILDRMSRNLLFRWLAEKGPYSLLRMVRDALPEGAARTCFYTNCDVCVELHHNPVVRRELSRMLIAFAARAGGGG